MKLFTYRAISSVGDVVTGEIAAENRKAAQYLLRERALDPLKIQEGTRGALLSALNRDIPLGATRSLRLRRDFASDLAMLRAAGAPLDRALSIMAASKGQGGALAQRVLNRSSAGLSLSAALEFEQTHFDPASIAMISAGEAAGDVIGSLRILASTAAERIDTRAQVSRALLYPVVLVLAALFAVALMVSYVLPSFEQMVASTGAELKPAVALVFQAGAIMRSTALPALLLVSGIVLAFFAYAATRRGRRIVDTALLRLPLLGGIVRDVDLAGAFLLTGRLIGVGTSVDRALALSGETCTNTVLRDGFRRAAEMVRTGSPVAESIGRVRFVPRRAVEMIAIGATAGSLSGMFAEAAAAMSRASRARTATVLEALPVLLTVAMGLVVAGLVAAMLSVLLSVNDLVF